MSDRTLTRRESKALTRHRLLQATRQILDDEGESALTTIRVAQRAGVAQSTFYTHFADMDELLESLADELRAERRRFRRTRELSRSAPADAERLRDTFRVPLREIARHPKMFRLLIRTSHHRSPLGDWSRSVLEEDRRELVEDLHRLGFPAQTRADRRRAEMIADGVIALTQTLALGHIEGRYPDVEELVDILVAFSNGYFALLES